jgi:hypothetical protein
LFSAAPIGYDIFYRFIVHGHAAGRLRRAGFSLRGLLRAGTKTHRLMDHFVHHKSLRYWIRLPGKFVYY